MKKCRNIVRYKTTVCIGNMDKRIGIYERKIKAPDFLNNQGVEYSEEFTLVKNIWSQIVPLKSFDIFAGINFKVGDKTHDIYVRYRSDINSQQYIKYKDNYYKVLNIMNFEEDSRFLLLECSLTGDSTLKGSQL